MQSKLEFAALEQNREQNLAENIIAENGSRLVGIPI